MDRPLSHHDFIHSIGTSLGRHSRRRDGEKTAKQLANEDKSYVRQVLKKRWIELLGENAPSIPYKKWSTKKIAVDVVGWPENIPFVDYGSLPVDQRRCVREMLDQIHFRRP
jgi:hypothetical protein